MTNNTPSGAKKHRESTKPESRQMIWFELIWITPEGFSILVANQGLEKARAYLNQVPPGPTALHPLRRMRCKLQVETLTFLGRAE